MRDAQLCSPQSDVVRSAWLNGGQRSICAISALKWQTIFFVKSFDERNAPTEIGRKSSANRWAHKQVDWPGLRPRRSMRRTHAQSIESSHSHRPRSCHRGSQVGVGKLGFARSVGGFPSRTSMNGTNYEMSSR